MPLLSFDFEHFVQVIKEKLSNVYTKTEIDNMLENAGYTKIDFTTTSSWVSGGIGFKLTLQHNGAKTVNVYHNLGNNKYEPVIVGVEILSSNITIESFEKFNGFVTIF